MNILENQMQSKFGCRELNKNEKRDLQNCHKINRQALTGHKFKKLFKSQATKAKTSDYLLGGKDKLFQGDANVTQAISSSKGDQEIADKPNSSSEGQSPCRTVCKGKQQYYSNDETQCIHDNQMETLGVVSLKSTSAQDHHVHSADSLQGTQIEGEQQKCVSCGHGGQVLCCPGQGCSRSFHLSCIKPPFKYVPPGVWHCIWCIKRKIDVDVYAVSEGIECILDIMLDVSDDEGKQKQKKYLVKYKGLAHIHNRWVSGETLVLESPALFSRYKRKHKKVSWKKEWCVPQCLLAKRFLVFPKQCNSTSHENSDCHYEWLVKWTGLGYDQATWELENATFLRTSEALKLINDFEFLQEKADHLEEDKRRKTTFPELPELPFRCQEHVLHVDKLCGYWHRDQNALVIDNQERVVRVVLFVLTLLKEKRGPFVIVTTSNALSIWKAEFSHWGSHTNVVLYKGSRNVRSIIRTFEFYSEKGNIMFQVLVSSYADVAEDIETFRNINWEVIILDECQRPKMSAHFNQIKLLAANMRVLLVSSPIQEWNFNYHSLLCLLDPQYNGAEQNVLDANPSSYACELKERLLHFVAYDCQSEKIKFVEFWVPVMLTDVQTEQYCASLFSKWMLLRSSSKGDSTGSLHDMLVSTRKCCDHPFLVDWSLRNVVLKGIPTADHFDVEIQLSGKLQLLNKILSEIKRRGLRVVIFFQSLLGSGTISVGDILDDFIHQKFGENTYIRIDGDLSLSKKQAACDIFNGKDTGEFVCLIEARACTPSTRLSSVDTIVIFNSEWDPLNDIKALEKITFYSKFEEMNIFRFYSSCTVEERVLILAKEGLILDGVTKDMKHSTYHKLLSWGASLLFSKLDGSTEFMASSLSTVQTCEQILLEDVFQELLHLLPRSNGESNSIDCHVATTNSINILKVQHNEGSYRGNFSLHGELIVQSIDNFSIIRHLIDTEPPHIFWTNLLEGKQPRWKYMSSSLQRIKKKVKYLDDLLVETEDEVPSKKAKADANAIDNLPPKLDFITKRPRSSATKRYTSVNNLADSGLPIRGTIKTTRSLRNYARNLQQHCEAVNLSRLTASTNNNYPEEEADSPAEWCLVPDQLHLSRNSTSTGDCGVDISISISGSLQNGCTKSTEGYAYQGQIPVDTSMEELACPSIYSIKQSVENLALQPSVTSIHGSLRDVASLGHQNMVHYSSNHPPATSMSTDSASLQKLMENMQESKELAVKSHNDSKLHIESEREKEIEKINKKYDMLIFNAENAIAKSKAYIETCYNIVSEHKFLAEATLQLQMQDQMYAAGLQGKWEGLLPEEPLTHRVTNQSAVEPAATRAPVSPEQDFLGLHSSNSAAMTSVQVVQQSSEAPRSSAKTSAGNDLSSADPGINWSSGTLPCEPMHTSHPRLPSIPTIRIFGSIDSRSQLRAPAPHLRHSTRAFSTSNLNP